MSSKHLLDPQLAPLAAMPPVSFASASIAQLRAQSAAARPPWPTPSPEVQVYEAFAPGRDGAPDVRLVVTAPKATGTNRPGILHVHGGGYVFGQAEMTGV